jgi:hypothetical protein
MKKLSYSLKNELVDNVIKIVDKIGIKYEEKAKVIMNDFTVLKYENKK